MMRMQYYELIKFLGKYVPFAKTRLIEKPIEINKNYFLKINSMEHKSDVGGVIEVNDYKSLEKGFKRLMKISNPPFILQEKIKGEEFIVGLKRDRTFGYVIMFGGGGILTELYRDVSFRKCPITKSDAEEMIRETKIGKLFRNYRGINLNEKSVIDFLVRISSIYKKLNFKSLDINPIIVNEEGAFAVDARVDL